MSYTQREFFDEPPPTLPRRRRRRPPDVPVAAGEHISLPRPSSGPGANVGRSPISANTGQGTRPAALSSRFAAGWR